MKTAVHIARLSRMFLWFGLVALLLFAPRIASADPTCAQLGTDSAYGLAGNKVIVASQSHLLPATAGAPAMCREDLTYSGRSGPKDGYAEGESEAIRIAVWLPVSQADGGSGQVQGAWNGKVVDIGGGGCAGSLMDDKSDRLLDRIKEGYAVTSTDAGWKGCDDAVLQDQHKLDLGKLNDFIYEGIHQQSLWGLAVAKAYYGKAADRNYWVGCSTGGRQALAVAQKFADEFDGILAGGAAIYWQEFRLADAWPQIVNRDLLISKGMGLTKPQFAAATSGAVAACDALDGVTDGIISDPRLCTWSAKNNICGKAGAPEAPNCLNEQQATAVDMMWDGPRNHKGERIWFGVGRGIPLIFPHSQADVDAHYGVGDLPTSTQQVMQYNHRDLKFNFNNLFVNKETMAAAGNPAGGMTYEDEATLGSNNTEDYMGTSDINLDVAKAHTKILLWHGTADPLIRWEGTMDYYRRVAQRYGGYDKLQPWFRFFLSPGTAHCQSQAAGSPLGIVADEGTLFHTLVNWVEKNTPPAQIPGKQTVQGKVIRTRPMCPYPSTAVYKGAGDINDAANYVCGGNLETKAVIAMGVRTQYKKENL